MTTKYIHRYILITLIVGAAIAAALKMADRSYVVAGAAFGAMLVLIGQFFALRANWRWAPLTTSLVVTFVYVFSNNVQWMQDNLSIAILAPGLVAALLLSPRAGALTFVATVLGKLVLMLVSIPAGKPLMLGPTFTPFNLLVIILIGLGIVLISVIARAEQHVAEQHARELAQANKKLQGYQADLEETVSTRTAELRAALGEVERQAAAQSELLAENLRQQNAIRELSVPLIPVSAQTIVVPLIGLLDGERLQTLRERMLHGVEHYRARRLILDVTGVSLLDRAGAYGLKEAVGAARLLGSEVTIVGVSPEVAETAISLDVTFDDVNIASTLQMALRTD